MKTLSMLIPLLVMTACFNKPNKEESVSQVSPTSKEDTVLFDQAKLFFKQLPPDAESKDNALTAAKVKLGKMLFYDNLLSNSGNNSCNSCHNLAAYGVDNEVTSVGDNGEHGKRNSPTVFNAALHNMQFWDGRARSVEEQAGMPILTEMAIPHKGFLVDRLKVEATYKNYFYNAFPGEADPINYTNVQKAIGAFERTLLTPSRFDKFMHGDFAALTESEKTGMKIFLNVGCANCHNGVGIGGESLQKFGLYTDYRTLTNSRVDDQGRMKVTNNKADEDVFKVPGLRNVEKTYPYFHDGSITSLDSTIRIMAKIQLDRTFTTDEVQSISGFLRSLTGDVNEDAKKPPEELKSLMKGTM